MTAAEPRRLLSTVGWFLLAVLWLWIVSALADAVLSSPLGVTEIVERSMWAASAFLVGAAFLAGATAILLARLHPRLGAETLRAVWIVGAIDVASGLAAGLGVSGGTQAASSLSEGVGYLAAAAVVAFFFRAGGASRAPG